VRFQIAMESMALEEPRSTCHQAWGSRFVEVTESWKKLPPVLPSTAAREPAVS
jgi:hypothetical protein